MKKEILIWLMILCSSVGNAQIKAQREYDYIDNEVNRAGLRKVGIYGPEGNMLYGCIDKDGAEVVPLSYNSIELNKDWNYIKVKTGIYEKNYGWKDVLCGLLTENGKNTIAQTKYWNIDIDPQIFKRHRCAIFRTKKDHYGIINNYNEEIVPPVYDGMHWINRAKGYLAVKFNGLWGIINYQGKEVILPQYQSIGQNDMDRYPVPFIQNDKIGYMNSDGTIIIPPQFDYSYLLGQKYLISSLENYKYLQNGIAILKKEKWGALDINSNTIIPFIYDLLFHYNGFSMWAKKDGKYALMSKDGKILTEFTYYDDKTYIGTRNNVKTVILNYFLDIRGKNDKKKKEKSIYYDDLGHEYLSSEAALAANEEYKKNDSILTDEVYDNLASLTWIGYNEFVTQQDYELEIGVQSESKIEDFMVNINGVIDRGIKTVNSGDYDLTINRTLTLNEGANVIKVSVRNAAGTAQEEKTIVYRPQGGELPSIEWLDFAATANKKEYQMKLGIKSKSKVEEVNVTVNGALTRGIKTVASGKYDLTVDRTLSLSEGLNRIVVSVRNGDGISTSEKVITYQGNNPTPVFNDKRIAFVIGNSHYSNSEMNLANPENDAKDVAEKLKSLGFEVVLKLDATLEDMDRELTLFGQKAKEYDVAMFYYAGHGIQSKGVNYLIPTNIDNLAEDNMKYKCVDMERVLDVMEDSKCKLKIVILDACRNDPLSRRWHRSTGTRGLSLMNAPIGTIISFSTAPGNTALDGKGRNSPYTEAFLNTLDMPNLDVFHFFQKVGASVLDKTQRSQNPWLSISFTGDFYFNKQ